MTSSKLKKIAMDDKKYLFQNYGDRLPVCFKSGDGSYLYDQDKKKYIDFLSGIAVSTLGYNNKTLSSALHKQIDKVVHTSNWFFNEEQVNAARLISELSFKGKTLFVNSGTEANEAAIKLARKYGLSHSKKKFQIVSFNNSFHGRTLGSMSATGQAKIQAGFGPLVPGFIQLPFNDIEAFKKTIKKNKNIAAIMLELVQGEGGIVLGDMQFIKELFAICKEKRILTIVDEVQTGIGRTGKIFSYQHFNIKPDVLTLAKGLGGGIPIGAIHARDELIAHLGRGSHGSTFGGNHMASTAAAVILEQLKKGKLLLHVDKVSQTIIQKLNEIKNRVNIIKEIRGLGLHIGFELKKPGFDMVKKALKKGLIINCTADNVIRIMPPLNISLPVAKEGMKILEELIIEEDI